MPKKNKLEKRQAVVDGQIITYTRAYGEQTFNGRYRNDITKELASLKKKGVTLSTINLIREW